MSRSVTVAVVYVMCVTSLSWRDSLKAVRGARNVANPNVGFLKQIQEFENERLMEERRRLRAKYKDVTLEDEDEQMAKQLLASYYHSMSIGEMCEGNCPPGVACPRGLCNPARRVGLFRRNSRDTAGSRSSSPSRHRSSSPSRVSNSPISSPVSPRRSSPTPPSPLIRRSSHSRSSSPQLIPPQSLSPSTHRRGSSPLSSPRHGSAPTSPNRSVSPIRSQSSSPVNSPYSSPVSSPKHSFVPIFGTRHSYTSPPGSPKRCDSPVSSTKRGSSPFSSPKRVSSAPNSPQHSSNNGSSYSPKNIFRKCSLWSHSSRSNSQRNKNQKVGSAHQNVDNDTDSQQNKKEHVQITKQFSLPSQSTDRLSPIHQVQRQNSLPHQNNHLTPQYNPSNVGPYVHMYQQPSLPEEETEESLQIHVYPMSSPQHQRYRWVTYHLPTNNHQTQSQPPEALVCPYDELFKQASLQESRYKAKLPPQTNENIPPSNFDYKNSLNASSGVKDKMLSRQSSLDYQFINPDPQKKPLSRQASLPEKTVHSNSNLAYQGTAPPLVIQVSVGNKSSQDLSLLRLKSSQDQAVNNKISTTIAHVKPPRRISPPLSLNKPQNVLHSNIENKAKDTLSVNQNSLKKDNKTCHSNASSHQAVAVKVNKMPVQQQRTEKKAECLMKPTIVVDSVGKKQLNLDIHVKPKTPQEAVKLKQDNSLHSPVKRQLKSDPLLESCTCFDLYKNQVENEYLAKTQNTIVANVDEIAKQHAKLDPQIKDKMPLKNPPRSLVKNQMNLDIHAKHDTPQDLELKKDSPIQVKYDPLMEHCTCPHLSREGSSNFQQSPVQTQTKQDSHVMQKRCSDSRIKSEKQPESPILQNTPPSPPGKRQSKQERKPDFSVKQGSPLGSPVKKHIKADVPLRQEMKEMRPESLLAQCTPPGSPVKRQSKLDSPIKQIRRPDSLLKQGSGSDSPPHTGSPQGSPKKKYQSPECSYEQKKPPESPLKKEDKSALPLRENQKTVTQVKTDQVTGTQSSIVRQKSSSKLGSAQSGTQGSPKHLAQQCQKITHAVLEVNIDSLKQKGNQQSTSYRPPCPPRKKIQPQDKTTNNPPELIKQSSQPVQSKSQKSSTRIHQNLTEHVTVLPHQLQAKYSPQHQQESKSQTVMKQQETDSTTPLKCKCNTSLVNIPAQQQKYIINSVQQQEQQQVISKFPQIMSQQQQQQHEFQGKSSSEQLVKKGEDTLKHPKPQITNELKSSEPRSNPKQPQRPSQATSIHIQRPSTPIQHQPRPAPPLPQSPKPVPILIDQQQLRSCAPCILPMQSCPDLPNPLQADLMNIGLNKAKDENPSSSVPSKITIKCHPDPLPKNCSSSHSSPAMSRMLQNEVNSSLDSCHNKSNSVTSTTVISATLSPVMNIGTSSSKICSSSNKASVNPVSLVTVINPSVASPTTVKSNHGSKSSLATNCLKLQNPLSKSSETLELGQTHLLPDTSLTTSSSNSKCPPLPLRKSPKPAVNDKQTLNTSASTKLVSSQ